TNPVRFLERLYPFLDLEPRSDKSPAEEIWDHDAEVLDAARDFYAEVESLTGAADFAALEALFAQRSSEALAKGDAKLWKQCVAAHRGFQLGLELLLMIPRVGQRSGFLDV